MKSQTNPVRTIVSTMVAVFAVFALAFVSLSARAETVKFHATLKTGFEVPAAKGPAHGTLTASFNTDTDMLTYRVVYSGLSGAATAAHFHGPATMTTDGPPQVMVSKPLESPISGTATLTAAQAKDLLAGKYYFNIHTAANPAGEVRGQVLRDK